MFILSKNENYLTKLISKIFCEIEMKKLIYKQSNRNIPTKSIQYFSIIIKGGPPNFNKLQYI